MSQSIRTVYAFMVWNWRPLKYTNRYRVYCLSDFLEWFDMIGMRVPEINRYIFPYAMM